MPKLMAYITAKPDISRADFIEYYESNHAPLVKRLLPMINGYVRNYLPVKSTSEQSGFDVVTELWFDDQRTLDEFWTTIRTPDVIRQIREDEANFLVSTATWMVEVEERTTSTRG